MNFSVIRGICFSFLISTLFAISCVPAGQVQYYNGLRDSALAIANLPAEVPIRKSDILYISVSATDQTNLVEFNFPNLPSIQGSITNGVNGAVGYLVDDHGMIDFPKMGRIKVDGLTKKQLSEEIKARIVDYVKNPVVTVRLMNFRVTVLGEVGRPGTYSVPSERITLIEALGNAGDITVFGRKDNVLLIRETDSVRTSVRLDLNDRKFLASPYYYLSPNDYIYVEPNKVRVNNSSAWQQSGPLIISSLSLLVVMLNVLIK
jgi:polysaccharide export outer membrane protein